MLAGKHVLVIGGSGMLKNASLQFATEGANVSVIGRNHTKLQSMANLSGNSNGTVIPVCVDYSSKNELIHQLQSIQQKTGPIDLIAAWIHGHAVSSHEVIVSNLQTENVVPYFLLKGSSSYNPTKDIAKWEQNLSNHPAIKIHEIILGFKLESGHSRWLTHEEISAGTIEAVTRNLERLIIGQTKPWGLKP